MKRELYKSSDYAGVTTIKGVRFYYGYEHTHCNKCKRYDSECEHDGKENCFVVFNREGKIQWRVSDSTLERSFKTLKNEAPGPEAYLSAGMALYIEMVDFI